MVVRKDEADRAVPGGLDAFAPEQPNYIEDRHLLRVGFMSTREALDLIEELRSLGLADDAVAFVCTGEPLPGWLRAGVVEGVPSVWLAGHDPGAAVPAVEGFMLRGPASLLAAIDSLGSGAGTTIRTGGWDGAERAFEVTRGDALVDLRAFQATDTDAVGVWGARRRDRRQACLADVELLTWVESTLRAAGATS